MTAMQDTETEEPRPHTHKETGNQLQSIRFSNNKISTLEGLLPAIQKVSMACDNITWIDLSFNQLKTIDPVFLSFPNLSGLYLHANQISAVQDVDKLAPLTRLRTLTLHGNPVESAKGYRQCVLARLPQLKHLDFCTITKMDRAVAITLQQRGCGRAKREKAEPAI
ncbi:leucine-rich repeat-containing protein 51 [Polychytrium aggregatum]|uniref:leucine-rich repeat-containing protein 51 n=1 Tax=Polychytrium aggregatum TaxID=110093 RepID=UPI0022FEDE69|nr:leucine-rich repeat-containing protein 51 [Polychytrium aggregatum]KAI9204094.1 leucine-rich repeat-containing protein 51 [Polychytrium aggregatum]